MEHYKIILPEYMNDQGNLFGGYLLKWLDEFAYVTVNLEFPGHRFVTIALDNVSFRNPIACGQILRFEIIRSRLGNTSVDYDVEVFTETSSIMSKDVVFATRITFVNVDEKGEKSAIPRD